MASSNRVDPAKLADELARILDDYRDDVADGTDEAALKIANQCRKDIRVAAAAKFNGTKYAKGWSRKQESKARGKSTHVLYNKYPGLPHLLENGHASVNGGRVPGRPHIKPAAEKAAKEFERRVKEVVQNAGG